MCIRDSHISNTPRQIHIQNALGYPELEYAHLPLVLGPDKKRLSKRHAATSLEEYREAGYLDTAIINTLSRLGWSKGDDEVFYLDDLVNNFNLSEVQKAGAIFDITKLDWVNSQHLANLSIDDMDLYEVNEAFAPVPLAWAADLKADRTKLNVKKEKILDQHVSKNILPILRKIVTDKEGTASLANVSGYEVGGKTGTAQKTEAGGYSKNKVNTLLLFFPHLNQSMF